MSKSQTFVYVQILETPSLTAEGSSGGKNIFKQNPAQTSRTSSSYCCSSQTRLYGLYKSTLLLVFLFSVSASQKLYCNIFDVKILTLISKLRSLVFQSGTVLSKNKMFFLLDHRLKKKLINGIAQVQAVQYDSVVIEFNFNNSSHS